MYRKFSLEVKYAFLLLPEEIYWQYRSVRSAGIISEHGRLDGNFFKAFLARIELSNLRR